MYNATLYRDTEMDKVSFQYDGTESDLWEKIGKVVYKSQIPNEIDVECDHGTVTLKVGKRGSYIENGVTYPTAVQLVSICSVYNCTMADISLPIVLTKSKQGGNQADENTD